MTLLEAYSRVTGAGITQTGSPPPPGTEVPPYWNSTSGPRAQCSMDSVGCSQASVPQVGGYLYWV